MKRSKSGTEEPIIILIDGDCPLCHRIARFVCKRDARERFRFAALRSAAGRRLLTQGSSGGSIEVAAGQVGSAPLTGRPGTSESALDGAVGPELHADSFVLIEGGKFYVKSMAALRVLRSLDGPWPLMYGAVALPAVLRDGVYDLIARWRYRLAGRGPSLCTLHADGKMRVRLIEDEEGDGA
ncbi:thiol-disulfide oxidoreductase DCC family protein [Paenibacillus glycinis]|uniref:DUF393 domain-containing protein n=1 Tax=Paenibacillus glycinis TaxID=2697035 RepID=A0ABW9XQ01_9BACL|nr:DCC1-like thiol-disulfide oxidoreductase family protein [Paenibacillus glycinis]NBD24714.1 DUF393 domain-containing protein [Paenibacillus glycinis]